MKGAGKRATHSGTAQRILDVAERLVQTRGFNGFSYADVAIELGVTKASLHYHYASKAELGEALLERYTERFTAALGELGATVSGARAKLDAYADLYGQVLRGNRMCLCGMLAAEYETLSAGMRKAVRRFFDVNEAWLETVVEEGRQTGELAIGAPARDLARLLVGGLEGAMLMARPYGEADRFASTAKQLIASLVPNGSA